MNKGDLAFVLSLELALLPTRAITATFPLFSMRLSRGSVDCSALIKKENQVFLIYKEIQNGAVAKSYIYD
jgi:hypothetical protein